MLSIIPTHLLQIRNKTCESTYVQRALHNQAVTTAMKFFPLVFNIRKKHADYAHCAVSIQKLMHVCLNVTGNITTHNETHLWEFSFIQGKYSTNYKHEVLLKITNS